MSSAIEVADGGLAAIAELRRHAAGGAPNSLRNARLKAVATEPKPRNFSLIGMPVRSAQVGVRRRQQ